MQDLYKELIQLLEADQALIIDDKLNKGLIIDRALKLDPALIKLLLTNPSIKKQFFVDIEGILVFDKVAFQRFVNAKNFLPDSYTQYKNKIGLSTDNDHYITDSREVVLVWPHKDCVLEGGQTKEDAKRNEIFYNTTLAPDEIDVLTAPKVLTNWKRYDKDGETIPTKISKADNLIIKGNNLLALHTLKEKYRGQVKLIYIDPPYNTASTASTFAYNNSFNHSTWLTFMKNRMEVAKLLLKNDGVICIAIDDEEYAHLKVLSDETFGRENYMGTIIVQSNPRGRTINSFFATCHEYALVYGKNAIQATVNNLTLSNEQEGSFGEADDDGKFRFLPFRRSGGTSTPDERPNSEFSIYYSKSSKKIIAVGGERKDKPAELYKPKEILTLNAKDELVKNVPEHFLSNLIDDIIEILPIDTLGKRRVWRWSDRQAILKSAKNDEFKIVIDKDKFTIQLKDRIKDGRKPKTIWTDSKYDASANGTMLIKKMFDGEKLFSYPKSLYTVKDTIQILTNLDSDDIVLDFFGGSGTTAQAVLDLNKEDEGNRRFILCEQMDYINLVTAPRVKKVIDKNKEGSFIYAELMQSNENYISQIQEAKTTNELLKNWDEMQETAFISYKVLPQNINNEIKDFEALSFEEQQRFLVEILDKNLLYVNKSEINDARHKVSEADKEMNKNFYTM